MTTESDFILTPDLPILTDRHAVYRCYSDQGDLLYVGTTGHLGKRLAAHAEKAWFLQVRGITLEWYADEFEALGAERRAIHVEHPKFNVLHRNARRPRNSKPRSAMRRPKRQAQPRPSLPAVPAAVTEARILQYIAEGHSASKAGILAGKSSSYGRLIARRATEGDAL